MFSLRRILVAVSASLLVAVVLEHNFGARGMEVSPAEASGVVGGECPSWITAYCYENESCNANPCAIQCSSPEDGPAGRDLSCGGLCNPITAYPLAGCNQN
jgi:hypothetical protein